MTTTAPPDTQIHTLQFKNGHALIRALSNSLVCSSADGTLPMLGCTRFEFADGVLETVSTNRYLLCVDRFDGEYFDQVGVDAPVEPFSFLLGREATKAVLTLAKANKNWPVSLHLDTTTERLEVRCLESSATYRVEDYSFPAWRSLMPAGDRVAVDRIGFTVSHLTALAKIVTDQSFERGNKAADSIEVLTYGAKKPTLIQFRDGGPQVLMMPYRLADES